MSSAMYEALQQIEATLAGHPDLAQVNNPVQVAYQRAREVVADFAAHAGDAAFIAAARRDANDDLEIDDHTFVSHADAGAWVQCWKWVANAAAGTPAGEVDGHQVAPSSGC